MEYNLEPIEITKELILKKISEEEIFEHYGIKIQKGLFCSKIRKDKNPTVSLYRNKNNRLMMKDFGDSSCYDCFGYVQALFGVSYYMALQIIANDFGIISRHDIRKNKPKIVYSGDKIESKEEAKIQVEIREWDEYDLNWWGKYGITKDSLNKFKVYPCKTVWLNGNLFYIFSGQQRVYGYYGGTKNGVEYWRLYFADKKKYKFVSNWRANMIQGAHLLQKNGGNYIVITKSMKDILTLYECGITAIAPCSENLFLTETQYNKIKAKYKHIYLLYDNDYAGISAANKIKKKFQDIKVLFLPRHGGDKDISDYYKAHGRKKTLELIDKTLKYYGETKEIRL